MKGLSQGLEPAFYQGLSTVFNDQGLILSHFSDVFHPASGQLFLKTIFLFRIDTKDKTTAGL